MIEQDVVVNTKYGCQPAFAACPEAPGQYPAIILDMDAPGFRDELRQLGKRIANRGYFCLVPDLYDRLGRAPWKGLALRESAMRRVRDFLVAYEPGPGGVSR